MPCAMSELRPAVFSEEDEKDSQEDTSALQPDAKMGEQSCASSSRSRGVDIVPFTSHGRKPDKGDW